MFFGRKALDTVIAEYLAHYNAERPHQGLDNDLIAPDASLLGNAGEVVVRERLGDLLNFYHRAAA